MNKCCTYSKSKASKNHPLAVNEKKQAKKEAIREAKLILNNKSDVMKAAHSFKKEGLTMSQSCFNM